MIHAGGIDPQITGTGIINLMPLDDGWNWKSNQSLKINADDKFGHQGLLFFHNEFAS